MNLVKGTPALILALSASGCMTIPRGPGENYASLVALAEAVQCELKGEVETINRQRLEAGVPAINWIDFSTSITLTVTATHARGAGISPLSWVIPAAFVLKVGPTASRDATTKQTIALPAQLFRISALFAPSVPACPENRSFQVATANGEQLFDVFGQYIAWRDRSLAQIPDSLTPQAEGNKPPREGSFTYTAEFTLKEMARLAVDAAPNHLTVGGALSGSHEDIHKIVFSVHFDPSLISTPEGPRRASATTPVSADTARLLGEATEDADALASVQRLLNLE